MLDQGHGEPRADDAVDIAVKDQTYNLATRGFIILPGVVAESHLDQLSRGMDRLLAEDDATWGRDQLEGIGQRGALRNLADRGREFELLLDLDDVHRLAAEMVGNAYILHAYDGLVLGFGEGRFPWDFHTDLHALRGVAFPPDTSPGINCLIAVDSSGPHNGGTWVVPASHRSVVRAPDPALLESLAVQPSLGAGDVLVFDARLWHCAGNNGSSALRRLIKLELVAPWLQPQFDYARSIRPEVAARLSARVRSVLGCAPPASVAEFLARQMSDQELP